LKAVRPYTVKGIILCSIIEFLCLPLRLIKGKAWKRAREFEENPRSMNWKDILYFAYKYYYSSPLLPSDDSIQVHFEKAPQRVASKAEVLATISLGGDLMPYSMIKEEYTRELWKDTGADFFGSDIVFANLETPLFTEKKSMFVPEVMLYDMHFNTDEATFNVFSGKPDFKGYDILSVANNHSLDQGVEGLSATIDFLKNKGIRAVGAKQNKEDNDFEIVEVKGIKVGFVAYTYSLNQFLCPEGEEWRVNLLPLNKPDCDISLIKQHVAACKKEGAEFIICSLHCGNAYQAWPSKVSTELFEKVFATCGVDVIAGAHPHNLLPWRNYIFKDPFTGKEKQGFAIYSFGDFIAYDIYTWCHLSAYVKLELGREADGSIVFKPIVRPLLMLRINRKLTLKYAEDIFNKLELSNSLKDMKVLYDICIRNSSAS
jgi:poly-gamma-glutamate synthesis protein (capsule biosynthesis protein)